MYKEKVEKQFSNGNLKEACIGIKTLAGQNTTQAKNASLHGKDLETPAEVFNKFYARFDKHDFSSEISQVKTDLGKFVSDGVVLEQIEEESVREVSKRVNAKKTTGPDGLKTEKGY